MIRVRRETFLALWKCVSQPAASCLKMSLKLQKRLAASILGCGKKRVWPGAKCMDDAKSWCLSLHTKLPRGSFMLTIPKMLSHKQ